MEELKIGGNDTYAKFGKKLVDYGNKIISRNTATVVINPVSKLVNPFTIMITFTASGNGSGKYQIVIQGDYKERYKDCEDGDPKLTNDEMFHIIQSHKNQWFKKE